MSDSFSCGVTRDLGIFDFFRSRTMSLSRRESRSSSQSASSGSSKTAGRSLAPSASMPPPAPASASFAAASSSSAAAAANVPPPLPESLDSVATTASDASLNNNDHLSDDDDDDDSDSNSDDGFGSVSRTSVDSSSSNNSVGSAITKYEVVRELGRGATAVVQLGRLRGGDELVALKVFRTSLLKKMREVKRVGRRMVVSTALDKVQVEIAIMKKLHHPNLLNLLEVFDDDSETLVLMLEYAPSGQVMQWYPEKKLYQRGKSKDKSCFSEEELRACVRQLLLGLEYLHENNICHRDLKPENILLGQDGTFKIADFGVAHFFEEDDKEAKAKADGAGNPATAKPHRKGYVSTTAGTYAFMGPETLKGGEYSAYAADIWALGITIHALAFGTIPFYDPDVVTLFEMIEKNPIELENNGNGASDGLVELLYGLLEKDPEKRWSLQKCKEHAWVLEGLTDKHKQEYVQTSYEAVTVGPEDLACAVTRVTSLNVILRVKLGANKWKRRAMKTLEDRRKSLQDGGSSFGESPSSRFSGVDVPESTDSEPKQPIGATTELTSNQLEI